jgi:hypothetical protein
VTGHVDDRPTAAGGAEAAHGGPAADDDGREIEGDEVEHLGGCLGVKGCVSEDRRVVDPAAKRPECLGTIGSLARSHQVRRAAHDPRQPSPRSVSVQPVQGRAILLENHDVAAVANQTFDDRTAHSSAAAGDHERSTHLTSVSLPAVGEAEDLPGAAAVPKAERQRDGSVDVGCRDPPRPTTDRSRDRPEGLAHLICRVPYVRGAVPSTDREPRPRTSACRPNSVRSRRSAISVPGWMISAPQVGRPHARNRSVPSYPRSSERSGYRVR